MSYILKSDRFFFRGHLELVSCRGDLHDMTMTVRRIPGWLGRIVGQKPTIFLVRGTSTVWRRWPSGRHCGRWMESCLHDIWQGWKHSGLTVNDLRAYGQPDARRGTFDEEEARG
jgi:hypothetical protein